MFDQLRRTLNDRLGQRGTLALGVVLVLVFVCAGGPLWVAGISSSIVAALLFAAILVAPAAWVLRDARRRGLEHAFLWALFALCGNFVAVIVYLLARDAAPRSAPCSCCGRVLESKHSACPWCGSPRSAVEGGCPTCRSQLEKSWRFCPYCRSEVSRGA